MNPFDQIAELYKKYPQPRTFEEDLAAHISTGYVVSTPDYFIMGRAVDRYAKPDMIEDPWHSFTDPNAWLVYAFAGSRRNSLSFVPFRLKWIGFQRRNHPLHWHDSTKLFQRIRQAG